MAEISEDVNNVWDLVAWNSAEQVVVDDIAPGEIPVENFGDDEELEVILKLQNWCRDLVSNWKERLRTPPLMEKAKDALNLNYSWYIPGDDESEDRAKTDLTAVIAELHEDQKDFFENKDSALLVGYVYFIQLVKENKHNNPKITQEECFKLYWEKYNLDINGAIFIKLYQYIQLKSYSEAICETIGSIMNIARGKGRNLEPVNFSKEVFCRVNLPPLHILKQRFIPEIVEQLVDQDGKLFFRKRDGTSKSWLQRLKYTEVSSSLENFRKKEEKQSKLPCELFK